MKISQSGSGKQRAKVFEEANQEGKSIPIKATLSGSSTMKANRVGKGNEHATENSK